MFWSLGLTADAAAAHSNDYTPSYEHLHSSKIVNPTFTPGAFPEGPNADSYLRPTSHFSVDEVTSGEDCMPTSPASSRPASTRKRSSRTKPKTTYQWAHPAPTRHKQRRHVRPKLLMQLHQVVQTGRPVPTLDIIPARKIAPPLARRYPRIFRAKGGLGPDDLIIMTSDSYSLEDDDGRSSISDEDRFVQRTVVATICQQKQASQEDADQAKVEFCFAHAPAWTGRVLPNGGYEFVSTNCDGTQSMARWVPRKPERRRSTNSMDAYEKRLTFSLIDPRSRRHPVLATVTKRGLDVSQYYPTTRSGTLTPSLGSPLLSPTIKEDDDYFDEVDSMTTAMDEDMRNLISVTAVWVALREHWSDRFSYNDAKSASPCLSASNGQQSNNRTQSATTPKTARDGGRLRRSTEPTYGQRDAIRAATQYLTPPDPARGSRSDDETIRRQGGDAQTHGKRWSRLTRMVSSRFGHKHRKDH